jgi:integrase/recombinase XerD
MKMNDKGFSYYVSTFLTSYLAGQRNHSTNTIRSYRDTFILLLQYLNDNKNISPNKVNISTVTKETVKDFLKWLEEERGCGISTRNQRLAAIHAFFRYVQSESPESMFQCQQILSISSKKTCHKLPTYLEVDEMKMLLEQPKLNLRSGRRDAALLSLLYDSGARVQELADLTLRSLRLTEPACVTLIGKGRKTRCVPVMKKTVKLLELYIQENRLESMENLDHPLFFNCHGKKLTRQGIAYIINKYAKNIDVTRRITPHQFRHSKAMHLTQADVNPVYIRDILGHVDIQTTSIYSKSDLSMKRKALEKIGDNVSPEVSDWTTDNNLLDFLKTIGTVK